MTCTLTINTRRIIPPLWLLLPALFSKLPARRGTVHIQIAYPRFASSTRVCCLTHTRHTCPQLTCTLSPTTVHLRPQRHAAIPCPAHPRLSKKALRRGDDPLRLLFFLFEACETHLLVQYQGTPCRARRAE